jgi:serine phosphatase RsbU (regulator of sigma subunit)
VNPTRTDQASRWMTLAAFGLAVAVFVVSPYLAISWTARPFPGFVVEQTLVVADYDGYGWNGRLAGLGYPERVTHVNNLAVSTPAEFDRLLSALSSGHAIQVRTISPDGSSRAIPSVVLTTFSMLDLARLFGLPYAVGLAYLAIGAWVYRLRGQARPSRAFANFCVWTSLTCGLLFDLITTHRASAVWTIAIAQEGSALISLALLFPVEWSPVRRRWWLRLAPYAISGVLIVWGLHILESSSDPWAYVRLWRYSYIYAATGIVIFLAMLLYRLRSSSSAIARQQARIILWGSLFAFVPLGMWLSAPLFGIFSIKFNPVLFLPFLLAFPLSIGVAILRYRLWDIDVIIHRTLIYGLLTVVLASLYLASVVAMQQALRTFTGDGSEVAIVASTLAIIALFNPLRRRIQDFIDRRFYRRKYDATKTLTAFSSALRDEVDLSRLVECLETVIWETMQPAHVLTWLRTPRGFGLYLFDGNGSRREWAGIKPIDVEIATDDPIVAYFDTRAYAMELDRLDLDSPALHRLRSAKVKIVLPLISQGELIGWLSLGPRLSEQDYSADDRALLTDLATHAAPAVRIAQLVNQQQAEAREREHLEQELRVARLIQETLLPEKPPSLPGWEIAVHWQPARAVGGDFYDFMPLSDGRLAFVVGDVADRGVPAALLMATTRVILRGTARRRLSPAAALQLSNQLLHPEIPSSMFVTCLYAILDPTSGRLQYASAGHNPPYRRYNGTIAELRATGFPLGMMPDATYEEHEASIQPGECLLLYSDGLVEAHNQHMEMFGYERLQTALRKYTRRGPALIEDMLAELGRFTGQGWEQDDDVTLVTVQRLEA